MTIRALRKLLERAPVRTVTVDVFDTALLRKVYPEELQFYLHGKRASKILREQAELDISPFAFVSLRQYVRKPIASERRHQGFDGEARLEEIFSLLLDLLLQAKEKTLDVSKKHDIVEALIAAEIALEKTLLRSNIRLLTLLRELKKRGTRLYFLSDMYLSRAHIGELLEHFGIADIFDGGVTSADVGFSKSSGRMYEKMSRGGITGTFDPGTHVHIGDHAKADFLHVKTAGCEAFLLRGMHHIFYRPIARLFGFVYWRILERRFSRTLRVSFQRTLHEHMRTRLPDARILFRLGFEVFGPALLHYLSYLRASSLFGKRPVYFVSSEAMQLHHLYEYLWGQESSSHSLAALNRSTTLRCFAYLALTRTAARDAKAILSLFWIGWGKETVQDFLESVGHPVEEWGFSRFFLQKKDHEEIVRMLASMCDAHGAGHPHFLDSLETEARMVKNQLNKTNFLTAPRLIIADVGWHGGVQLLLEHIVGFFCHRPDVRGIYLGKLWEAPLGLDRPKNVEGVVFNSLQERNGYELFTSALWERVLSQGQGSVLASLIAGIEQCFSFWTDAPTHAPDLLFRETMDVRSRFFRCPSRDEVRLLGNLEHDDGAGKKTINPLVHMGFSRRLMWKLFFFHPSAFLEFYGKEYWQRGLLRWYGLYPFASWRRCKTHAQKAKEREKNLILSALYEEPIRYAPMNVPFVMAATGRR